MSLYSAGARVTQAQYGDGTVTAANDRHTVIDFDMHGVRTFATSIVRLERSTTLAPPKAEKPRRRAVKRAVAAPEPQRPAEVTGSEGLPPTIA